MKKARVECRFCEGSIINRQCKKCGVGYPNDWIEALLLMNVQWSGWGAFSPLLIDIPKKAKVQHGPTA